MGFSDIPPPPSSCRKRCRSEDPSSHAAAAELCSSSPPPKLRPFSPISHLSLLEDLESSLNALPAAETVPTCEDLVAEMINSLEQAIGDSGHGELITSSGRLCGDLTLPGPDMLLTVAPPPEDMAVRKLDVLPAAMLRGGVSPPEDMVVLRETASPPQDMVVRMPDAFPVMVREAASLPEDMAERPSLPEHMAVMYEAASPTEDMAACKLGVVNREAGDTASPLEACEQGDVNLANGMQHFHYVSEVELDGFGIITTPSTPTNEQIGSQWSLFDDLVATHSSSNLSLDEGCVLPSSSLSQFEDEGFFSHFIENSELPLQDCYL